MDPTIQVNIWPKAPAKEGALGQISKNFQVYFIHINLFKDVRLWHQGQKCD